MKYKAKADLDIDVGAFADIAFLLIIFFVLTTSIQKISGREIPLPASQQAETTHEEPTLNVVLTGREILYGYGEKTATVDMATLRVRLFDERFPQRNDPKARLVVVDCSDDVEWDQYFKVMTAISHAGGIVAVLDSEQPQEARP